MNVEKWPSKNTLWLYAFEDKLVKKHMKVWASCHAWILSFAMLLVQCG